MSDEVEPSVDVLEMLARFGGEVPDPERQEQFKRRLRSPGDMVATCVRDLSPADQEEFLDELAGDWTLLLVLHDCHPALGSLLDWASKRGRTLLLATPSGPPPPAIATIERAEEIADRAHRRFN